MHLTYGRLAVLPLHLPLHALEAFTNKNNFSIESNWNALIRFPTSNGAKCCHSFPLISTCGSYMEIILFESPFIRKLYAQILTSKLCYFDRKVETVGRMCQNFFHLYSNEILINFFFLSRISFVLLTYLFLRFGIHVIANVVIRYFFFSSAVRNRRAFTCKSNAKHSISRIYFNLIKKNITHRWADEIQVVCRRQSERPCP